MWAIDQTSRDPKPRIGRLGLSCFLMLTFVIQAGNSLASENLRVTIDKNHVLRTDRPVETIIVGNPHIADVSAQSNQLMFVLGRTSGETNILGFDKDGNVVFDKDVTVVPHTTRTVTLHRGSSTETFACAPRCESEMHPGDDSKNFSEISGQNSTHTGAASGAASGASSESE